MEATVAPPLRGIHYLNLKILSIISIYIFFFSSTSGGGGGVAPTSAASKTKVFVRLFPQKRKKNRRGTAGKLLKLRHTASSAVVNRCIESRRETRSEKEK